MIREQERRRSAQRNTRGRNSRVTKAKPKARRKRRRLSRAGRLVVLACTLLALALAAGAGVWLVLPVGTVSVTGQAPYPREKVLQVSGITAGDRLFGVDKKKTARLLETNLPYISSVSVSWRLPDTLVLHLVKAVPVAAVPRAGGYAVLDAAGKVLETPANLQAFPGLPTVTGPDAGPLTPGQVMTAAGKAKMASAVSLLRAIKAAGIPQVTSVDVHDSFQITFGYQNRITVLIGTSADFDEKLRFAAYMLTKQLLSSDTGTLDVSKAAQNNQAVFSPAGQ